MNNNINTSDQWVILQGFGDFISNPDGCEGIQFAEVGTYASLDDACDASESHYLHQINYLATSLNSDMWQSFWCAVVPAGLTLSQAVTYARTGQ